MTEDDRIRRLQRLYAAPLDAFVATRNELANALKPDAPAEAEDIAATRKPAVTVWTVNQLSSTAADEMGRLLESGRSLKEALGSGDVSGARAAGTERKQAIAALVARAEEVLSAAGHAASSTTLEQISTILLVGSTDPAIAERLRLGILQRAIDPSETDPFAAGMMFPDASGEAGADSATEDTSDLDERLRAAEARARELAHRAAELETEASGLELDAKRAERAAAKARKEADRARREADRAEEELERMRDTRDRG